MELFLVVEQPGPTAQRLADLRQRGLTGVNGAYNHAIFEDEKSAKKYIAKEKKKSRGLRTSFYTLPMTLGETR